MPKYTPPGTPNLKELPLIEDKEPLKIEVVKATVFRGPLDMPNVYPMTKKVRGLCLIIDNEKFINDVLPFREGSKIDSNNLDILFEQLGFKVIKNQVLTLREKQKKLQWSDTFKVTLRRNLSYQEMMETIQNFAKAEGHLDAQMCVVIILSHGDAGGLINAADKREVPTEYVLRRFNNDSCPMLKGKPKFFVFQACRGDEVDYGTIPRYARHVEKDFTFFIWIVLSSFQTWNPRELNL